MAKLLELIDSLFNLRSSKFRLIRGFLRSVFLPLVLDLFDFDLDAFFFLQYF